MFKKILIPIDGSESSWRAFDQAKELAVKFEGELVVVNIIQPYNNAALLTVPLDHGTIANGNDELESIGQRILEAAKERLADYQGKVSYDLEVGHPSEKILAISKTAKCDTIVIGSRGLSGIAEFFLGSVSSKVSQYASVPVLLVK